jgi:hypothetical protein
MENIEHGERGATFWGRISQAGDACVASPDESHPVIGLYLPIAGCSRTLSNAGEKDLSRDATTQTCFRVK